MLVDNQFKDLSINLNAKHVNGIGMTHLDFSVDVQLLDLNYRWMCPEYNQNDTFRLVVCTPITNVIIGMPAQCAVSYRKSFLHPLHYISPQKTYYTNWIFCGFLFWQSVDHLYRLLAVSKVPNPLLNVSP